MNKLRYWSQRGRTATIGFGSQELLFEAYIFNKIIGEEIIFLTFSPYYGLKGKKKMSKNLKFNIWKR